MSEFLNNNKMFVKRLNKVETGRFTQLQNYLIDADFSEEMGFDSLGAKPLRLLALLVSFKDGWKFIPEVLKRKAKLGETAFRNSIKELVKSGFMKIEKILNEKGQFVKTNYYVSELPDFKEENEQLKKGVVHYIKQSFQTLVNSISYPCDKNPHMDSPHMDNPCVDNQLPKEPLNSDNNEVVAVANNTNLSNTNLNNTYIRNTSSEEVISNRLLVEEKIKIEVSENEVDDVSYIENSLEEEISEEELEGFEDPEAIRKIILAEREEMKKKNLPPLKPEEVEKIMKIEKVRAEILDPEISEKLVISKEESEKVRELLENAKCLDKDGKLIKINLPEKYIFQYTEIESKKLTEAHVALCIEKISKICPKSSPIGYFKSMLDNPTTTADELEELNKTIISKEEKLRYINFFHVLTGKRDEDYGNKNLLTTFIFHHFFNRSNELNFTLDHVKARIKDAISVFGEEFTMNFLPKKMKEIV